MQNYAVSLLAGVTGGERRMSSLSRWDDLASALPADILLQPKMLEGGNLREYQMQVSELNVMSV